MATTQRFRRLLGLILAAAATWAVVVPSHAGQNWMPLLPSTDFHDFQLFAPPDLQDYAVRPDLMELFVEQATTITPELSAQVTVPQFNAVNASMVDRLEQAFLAGDDPGQVLADLAEDITGRLS